MLNYKEGALVCKFEGVPIHVSPNGRFMFPHPALTSDELKKADEDDIGDGKEFSAEAKKLGSVVAAIAAARKHNGLRDD
jgi:hypothetical protein